MTSSKSFWQTYSAMRRKGAANKRQHKHVVAQMQPEQRLLLLCARVALSERERTEVATLLHQSLDWEYLLRLAEEHRVMALLYWHLQKIGLDTIPLSARTAMQEQFQETAWNNPRMAYEVLEIVQLLEQHGIPALPYKGPILALQVYGNLALRQFVDLDVMIPRHHFAKAKQLLQSRGYSPNPHLVTVPDNEYMRWHHDYPFLSKDEEIAVELQWGLMEVPFVFPPDFDAWWRRLKPTTVAGRTVLGLTTEDLLLILCMHGGKHVWSRLVWICDIAALLHTSPQIDWNYVIGLAHDVGCLRMLLLGLLLAQELLNAQLPPIATALVQDKAVRDLADAVYKQLFIQLNEKDAANDITPIFYLQMVDRLKDRLQLCKYCLPGLLQHPKRVIRLHGLKPFRYLLGL